MKLERRRDNQQWLLDHLVKTTGRVQNFAYDDRQFPPEVKSYWMIPRAMGRIARHQEGLARAAEQRGYRHTACELYYKAAYSYHHGQHTIYKDDNPEKIHYHGKLVECYDKVIELNDYPMEKVEVPWEGVSIACVFHIVPGRPKAPTVLFVPGMDMTKEVFPDPTNNVFVKRGINLLCMDGPGQGTSNIRKIRVTADNYERAGKAVIDYLMRRPEVDGDRIGLCGMSMGSFWAPRIAAYDSRVKAVATAAACYGDKRAIFEEASPRFKQMFMYMSGIHDEEKFDTMAEKMTTLGYGHKIRCASLMVVGEYDPLCHLEDTEAFYNEIAGPKEIWVLENDFHAVRGAKGLGGMDVHPMMADWLKEAMEGKLPKDLDRRVLVPARGGLGPYGEPMAGRSFLDRED